MYFPKLVKTIQDLRAISKNQMVTFSYNIFTMLSSITRYKFAYLSSSTMTLLLPLHFIVCTVGKLPDKICVMFNMHRQLTFQWNYTLPFKYSSIKMDYLAIHIYDLYLWTRLTQSRPVLFYLFKYVSLNQEEWDIYKLLLKL